MLKKLVILSAVTFTLPVIRREAVDLRRMRAELVDADFALSDRVRDRVPDALLAALTETPVVVASRRGPLRSRADIREWMATDSLAAKGMRWYPVRADVSADGRDGYTYGFLTLTGADGVERPGKYLAYWRRDATGQWRVAAWKRLPREAGLPGSIPRGFEMPTHRSATANAGGKTAAVGEITETDLAFAKLAQAGASAAFEKYVAPDGATLGGGPGIAYGPRLAAAEFSAFAPGTINWAPQIVDAAGSGDLGFAVGPVMIRETPGSESRTVGYYLTIWKRQADGSWKVVIDG